MTDLEWIEGIIQRRIGPLERKVSKLSTDNSHLHLRVEKLEAEVQELTYEPTRPKGSG